MLTLGVGALLVVVFELHVTTLTTEAKQREISATLERNWADPEVLPDRVQEGDGIVRLHVPSLRPDFAFTVLEGTGGDTLAAGPGHYADTALPGQRGNFALAGHRVTHGAPFERLDELRSCDALVVETRARWFVYRVLPMSDEVQGWAAGRGGSGRCRDVTPLAVPYMGVRGRTIVEPTDRSVIASVPGQSAAAPAPPGGGTALITLTTCEPKYSARQRLIVHGVLVAQYPRTGARPVELSEG